MRDLFLPLRWHNICQRAKIRKFRNPLRKIHQTVKNPKKDWIH